MNELTGADFKSATEMKDDNKKLFIETYGCQMNVADSEVICLGDANGGLFRSRNAGGSRCRVYEYLFHPRQCGAEDSESPGVFPLAEEKEKASDCRCTGLYGTERVKDDLITNHHVDLVVVPDAYLTLPDLIAYCRNR